MTPCITHTDKINFIKEIAKHLRNDVYAERYIDKKDRLAKYRPIKESITDEVLLRHINHEQPIGGYSVLPDKIHILSAAYDLDAHKDKHRAETDQVITEKKAAVRSAAMLLIAEMQKNLLVVHPFLSGGGIGMHLWLFFEQPQKARDVRRLMKQILESVGFKEGSKGVQSGEIEIFPKQDKVEGAYGNLIALPFARQSKALDINTLEPIPEE